MRVTLTLVTLTYMYILILSLYYKAYPHPSISYLHPSSSHSFSPLSITKITFTLVTLIYT